MKSLVIGEAKRGQRFDVVATEMLPTLSRMYVHALIEGKRILLNGLQQKGGYKLEDGDVITTDFNDLEADQVAAIELPILYEDANMIVIDKPEGIASHSRGRYWNEPSVASFVRQVSQQVGERAAIVNRLDRATSGLMLCAKNHTTLSFLQKQFSARKVKKAYIAVVRGRMDPPVGTIDSPIERNPSQPSRFRVGATGKSAQTGYSVIGAQGEYQVLRMEPTTGRTHQLRVHLASSAHPIVGDEYYGGEVSERMFLHAQTLEITLPGGSREVFEAPLPNSFMKYASAFSVNLKRLNPI